MIVGNGMLARAFGSYAVREDELVFASGVSNSRETTPDAFEREVQLLEIQRTRWLIIILMPMPRFKNLFE